MSFIGSPNTCLDRNRLCDSPSPPTTGAGRFPTRWRKMRRRRGSRPRGNARGWCQAELVWGREIRWPILQGSAVCRWWWCRPSPGTPGNLQRRSQPRPCHVAWWQSPGWSKNPVVRGRPWSLAGSSLVGWRLWGCVRRGKTSGSASPPWDGERVRSHGERPGTKSDRGIPPEWTPPEEAVVRTISRMLRLWRSRCCRPGGKRRGISAPCSSHRCFSEQVHPVASLIYSTNAKVSATPHPTEKSHYYQWSYSTTQKAEKLDFFGG